MASQPEVPNYGSAGNVTFYSQPVPFDYMTERQQLTADQKIAQFEAFKAGLELLDNSPAQEAIDPRDDSQEYTADEIATDTLDLLYFIGRLNPPHDGHITALTTLVGMAKDRNTKALILLGSGPKKERTMDNPIDFDTKKTFIDTKLREAFPGVNIMDHYEILEMKTPFSDVARYVGAMTRENTEENIHITHIAGDKDDDLEKLRPVLSAAERVALENNPGAIVTASVQAIAAAPNASGAAMMSATQVRKDAYNAYSNFLNGIGSDDGFSEWPQEYKDFYGSMSRQIYAEILYPIKNLEQNGLTPDVIQGYIQNYIMSGTLPKLGKVKARKGGKRTIRRKKNKTQKRPRTARKYKTAKRRTKHNSRRIIAQK
jgi:hypothetical protein